MLLADLQEDIGAAVVDSAIPGCASLLVGGHFPVAAADDVDGGYALQCARVSLPLLQGLYDAAFNAQFYFLSTNRV